MSSSIHAFRWLILPVRWSFNNFPRSLLQFLSVAISSCQFAYVRSSFFLLPFLLFLDVSPDVFVPRGTLENIPRDTIWVIEWSYLEELSRLLGLDIADKSWPMHAIRIILSFLFSPLFFFSLSFNLFTSSALSVSRDTSFPLFPFHDMISSWKFCSSVPKAFFFQITKCGN